MRWATHGWDGSSFQSLQALGREDCRWGSDSVAVMLPGEIIQEMVHSTQKSP